MTVSSRWPHGGGGSTARLPRAMGVVVCGVLLCVSTAPATAQAPSDSGVANEYRVTAFPSYRITDKVAGFGYLGWVYKPDASYTAYYLGKGVFYSPAEWVQVWGGLISVYTDATDKSNTLEVRPFAGVKFLGSNGRKWRYYNWTRYEVRFTETLDTDEWQTVHRIRNQTRLEIPFASPERAWQPKTWYMLSDVEPIYRSDTGQIDPLRLRVGLGHVVSTRLLVEVQYFAQFTHSHGGGLAYTDNIFRLNFKMSTRGVSVLQLLSGGMDD